MTWPFENDTSNIEKKLAKRSLHHERQRNLFAIIALALTAFMITATFSIGFSYFETYQMQQIRLMGTTADAGITNVTEEQLVEISKSSLVLDVGIQQRLGSVDTEQLRNARLGVVWLDDEWTVVTMDGSLSAHYENTILITDGDPEILTLTK